MYNGGVEKLDLDKISKIHFIGIGGIGISAIARMMILEGKEVSGSDRATGEMTLELEKLGAKIVIGQKAENINTDIDLVVYTIAITDDNPELMKAKELGLKTMTYSEMLGMVSASKYLVAVAGTHGKTTTTAMLAKVFIDAKLDPTVVVGSILKDQKSNFIAGQGKHFIAEACEYRRSFLNLNPQAVIITNIDNDHLDYYKDLADIQSAFISLVEKIPADGFLVCDPNDENLKPVVTKAKCQVIDYSTLSLGEIKLKVPGEHVVKDAKAALAIAQALGIEETQTLKSLAEFSGAWRRFEYKGTNTKGTIIYDDYGHHPTEIRATLAGARQFFGDKKITAVFQPHLYSRTKLLLNDFAKSFGEADQVIVTDIYAAREKDDGTVKSEDLVSLINQENNNALYLKSFSEIEKYLIENNSKNDVVITLGAGNVYEVGEQLTKD